MNAPLDDREREILVDHLREAYMEIYPAPGIEDRLAVLPANSYVAVTCSPSKGIDETLELSETLIQRGYRVAPHIAARNVRDRRHLADIVARLRALGVESIFVPGGDRREPVGAFGSALELLKELDEMDHNIDEIGIAAHPEGHPDVDDETLFRELRKKHPYAQYIVPQMCFDADRLGAWLLEIRRRGITLPVWIGLPGAIDRGQLLKASLRIGVGDSLRFLRRSGEAAARMLRSSLYQPDELVLELASIQAAADANVAGYHLFCFNQVANTESWRNEALERLA